MVPMQPRNSCSRPTCRRQARAPRFPRPRWRRRRLARFTTPPRRRCGSSRCASRSSTRPSRRRGGSAMHDHLRIGRLALVVLSVAALSGLTPRAGLPNAHVIIVNNDGPNEGFNDPTPASPVGGNVGTTVGQQRLIAFQFAADIWANTLDSDVDVRVDAQFNPLACTATAAVLGSAGPTSIFANFGAVGLHPGPL